MESYSKKDKVGERLNVTEKKSKVSIEAEFRGLVGSIGEDLDHRFIKDRELLEKVGFKGGQDEVYYLPERDRVYVGVESIGGENMRTAIWGFSKKN